MRHLDLEAMSRPAGVFAPFRRETSSADETERLGEDLAAQILAGTSEESATVLLLHGPLGAGKTCLVRGLARGLGCRTKPKSPTFALHLSYPGRRVLHHLDLYRLEESVLDELGLFDLFSEPGVVAVEWGERLGRFAPAHSIHVEIVPTGEDRREIRIDGPPGIVARLSGAAPEGAA